MGALVLEYTPIYDAAWRAARARASAACFALQFGQLSEYPNAIALAKDNSNLSVFAPDRAIIRRGEGPWRASSTIDVAALRGAFEVVPEISGAIGQAPNATQVAEVPRPCRMTLGDFKQLGDFLDEFSGYSSPPSAGVS